MAFALGPRAQAAGARLIALETTPSTNTDALARVRAGERGPFWVVTSHQTAGRGRRHRPWIAPPGNLATSVIEIVDAPPSVAATLGFAAGLALDAALRALSKEPAMRCEPPDDTQFALKWPNDVLLGASKVAGILLETETVQGSQGGSLAVVAGMGVNVAAAPQDTPYPATSLAAHGRTATAQDVFGELSDSWTEFFGIWNNGRGFAQIRTMWLERAAGLGGPIAIRNAGRDVQGIFETIDADGCLVVTDEAGKRMSVAAGDVYFGTAMSAGAH